MTEQPLYTYLNQASLEAVLEQHFDDGLEVDAMFTMIDNRDLAAGLFELPPLEYSVIFSTTSYEHLLQASPYLCRLTKTHPFTATLVEKPAEFGFFTWGAATRKACADHWRSLLNADMPDNTTTHFRFYSASVMELYLRASNQQEIRRILGPYAGIAVPISNDKWLRVDNPALESMTAQELAQTYQPSDAFAVTSEQLAAMEEIGKRDYLLAIVSDFFVLFEESYQYPPEWIDFDSAWDTAEDLLDRLDGELCPEGKLVECDLIHAVLMAMELGAPQEQLKLGIDAFCKSLPAHEAGLLRFEAICPA